jgi:sulfatase maturation enzyme AslB (radical SAM superfamily)
MGYRSPTGIAPVLQVHPSRRCNIECAHCYTLSGPKVRGELPLELLANCLTDAFDLGYRQLAVSGGEPLLYAPLADLLAHARALGMLTTITSNGMLATPARWDTLAPFVDALAISIDGRPAEHDAFRRREGAFARTVANFKNIRSSGVPFGLIFTLTQHNVDSLEFIVRLAAEHSARAVQVHPLTLYGRAAAMLPEARPDGIELSAALLEASRLGRDLGVAVHVDALSLEQLVAFRDHVVPVQPVTVLAEVAPLLVVEANALVMPLTHELSRSFVLGSLTEERLSSLADRWLAAGRGDELAEVCARTWTALTGPNPPLATYWYDEVATRSHGSQTIAPTFD